MTPSDIAALMRTISTDPNVLATADTLDKIDYRKRERDAIWANIASQIQRGSENDNSEKDGAL